MSETTELAQQVADLTTSTTNLTNTVVGQVERLSADVAITDQKATEAANSAIAAEDSAVAANTHKANAKVEADRAKSEADNAASVVTGGTATLDSEAGKIPLADSDGKIDLSWLPAEAQGYNAFAQEQAVNNDKFAASGFVHFGSAHPLSARRVNRGLWASGTIPNAMFMGRSNADAFNDSKSEIATINVAGHDTTLDTVAEYSARVNFEHTIIKFPDAPNGTVTYDSATGEIVDYTKDVDPKYGDVAPDVNEAVARAFEGVVKNGDFRLGDVGWSNGGRANTLAFSEGGCAIDANGDNFGRAIQEIQGYTPSAGDTHEIEVYLTALSGNADFIWRDSQARDNFVFPLKVGRNVLSVTPTVTDAANIRVEAHNDPAMTCLVSHVYIQTSTTEVVTERVDMWGFEGWLEEVSQANPYVYQNGLIQSQATDIDGVATGDSNRPDTYYAVFDGDTTSRGNGVNFWSITDAQRKAIFSNPDNKLYLIDGKIYQWRLRQRTIAGAGNGDWGEIDSTTASFAGYADNNTRMYAQGVADTTIITGTDVAALRYRGGARSDYKGNTGVLEVNVDGVSDAGVDGHCYFLVCGTVSRLNQGAYHPSFNAMGTAAFGRSNGVSNVGFWYTDDVDLYNPPTASKDCFMLAGSGGSRIANYNSGTIAANTKVREDDRRSDAIYASGLGGVVLDMRYSAWDKSAPEHKAKALAMVENGTYRGVEKLVETRIATISSVGTNVIGFEGDPILDATRPDEIIYYCGVSSASGETYSYDEHPHTTTTYSDWYQGDKLVVDRSVGDASATLSVGDKVVVTYTKNHSVGGEFPLTEVIGDPANILTNPDLKEGWLGVWNPQLPDGSGGQIFSLSRKNLESTAGRVSSSDSGATWIYNGPSAVDTVNNTISMAPATTANALISYTAFAKQTKPSTNQPVFNGEAGVGSVFASMSPQVYDGVLLGESLYGGVAPATWANSTLIPLNKFDISGVDGELYEGVDNMKSITHLLIDFAGYTDACMLKTLTTQLNVNDQASIQFQYEELVHNGTDWGDDGKMFITATGDSTNTDENGTVVKCGVHELAVPYGWCKVEV